MDAILSVNNAPLRTIPLAERLVLSRRLATRRYPAQTALLGSTVQVSAGELSASGTVLRDDVDGLTLVHLADGNVLVAHGGKAALLPSVLLRKPKPGQDDGPSDEGPGGG